ncbi:MAG: DUF3459 domain-containing protein, partial [Phycicoccus sp.]
PQDPATRDRSVLRWSELDEPDAARMLRWYAALIDIRRAWWDAGVAGPARPAGHGTRFTDVACAFDEDAGWFVMTHTPPGRQALAVAVNLGTAEAHVPVVGATGIRLAWDADVARLEGEAVVIPPDSVAVVSPAP